MEKEHVMSLLREAYMLGFGGGFSTGTNDPLTEEAKDRAINIWKTHMEALFSTVIDHETGSKASATSSSVSRG